MKLPAPWIAVKPIWQIIVKLFEVIARVLLAIVFLSIPIGLIRIATDQHWLLGFPVVLLLSFVVHIGIRDYQAGRISTWQGIVTLGSILSIIVSAFTFLSFALNKFGIAHYGGFNPKFVGEAVYVNGTLFELYVWELFEIIPGVKVNEAFGRKTPPLERSGFWAGILVLTFRVILVFIVLDVFRKWWGARKRQTVVAQKTRARTRSNRGRYGRHSFRARKKTTMATAPG